MADFESQKAHDCSEIELSLDAFSIIVSALGLPFLDPFSSSENSKGIVSLLSPVPECVSMDAFSVSWSGDFLLFLS